MDWLTQSRSTTQGAKKRKTSNNTQLRDQMVLKMKAIVGTSAPDTILRNCLFLSKNNLERAVDRFFSLNTNTDTNESPSPLRSGVKRSRSNSSSSQIQLSKERLLGWCLINGRISNVKGATLAVGDELILIRDSVGSPFVRFGSANDPAQQFGTLEPKIASFLGPLLDKDILIIKATCSVIPDGPLTSFSSIQIGLEISVDDLIHLHTDVAEKAMRKHVHDLIIFLFPQVQAKVEQEARREAAKQEDIQEKQSVNELFDDDNEDDNNDNNDSNDNSSDKNTDTAPNVQYSYPNDISSKEVNDALSSGLRITLKKYQINALKWMLSRERPHQENEDGTSNNDSTATTNARSLVHNHAELLEAHPLWVRLPLQRTEHDDINTKDDQHQQMEYLFVNPYSREVKTGTESPELKPCRGGILADEMGLGKTIETLALLIADKALRQQKYRRNQLNKTAIIPGGLSPTNNGSKKKKKRRKCFMGNGEEIKATRATLVVVPMSVLGQWQDEIRKRTFPGTLTFVEYYGSTVGIGGGDLASSSSSSSSTSFSNTNTSGSGAFKSLNYLSSFDIVLTTFGTLAAEMQRLEKNNTSTTSGLLSIQWRRVVLDEAHTIKNRSTLNARACCKVKSSRRWCLTGTPMQNGIDDIFSLVIFLKHQPWSEPLWWNKVIRANVSNPTMANSSSSSIAATTATTATTATKRNNSVQMLRVVLEPIMLRRTKGMIMNAKSGGNASDISIKNNKGTGMNANGDYNGMENSQIESSKSSNSSTGSSDLPFGPPDIQEIRLSFSLAEREFYDGLFQQTKAEFTGFALAGTLSHNYATLLTLLLRLRQACDHPYLVIGTSNDASGGSNVSTRPSSSMLSFFTKTKTTTSGTTPTISLSTDSVAVTTLSTVSREQVRKEATEKLFHQWQESSRRKQVANSTTTSSSSSSSSSSTSPTTSSSPTSTSSSISATSAIPPRHVRDLLKRLAQGITAEDELECPVCFEIPGTTSEDDVAIVTPCGHGPICEKCLYETLKFTSNTMNCPICRVMIDRDLIFRVKAVEPEDHQDRRTYRALLPSECVSHEESSSNSSKEKNVLLLGTETEIKIKTAPTSLDLSSGRIKLHSAKLDAMVLHLRRGFHDDGQTEPQHQKAVVFSQWTQMLNLVGYVLDRESISFVRLDGSMSQQARQRQLKRFKTRPDIKVMVMSLKAGSLGLNLTCASLVIMLDPWWNPSVEDQAINRCHRIGQTRKVEVLRMIVEESCEQRMLALQRMKSNLAQSVLTSGTLSNTTGKNKMTLDDLKMFFN